MNGRACWTGSREDEELLRQQTVLARFGEFALKSENLDEILAEACRLVGEALGTDLAKVVELQEDGQTLLVRAGLGWRPGVVGEIRLPLDERSSEGHALKSGDPVTSPNIDEETRFHYPAFLKEHGVRAIANVIIIGGRDKPPYGILQVDSREPREFTESDVAFLRSYANLIAAAVDRLRVLAQMRDSNRELERRVAERTRQLEAEAAERERAQKALRQAHAMETLVEHLPIGAGLIGPSGHILVANPQLRRLLPRPLVPSVDPQTGSEWTAFHPDGQRVAPQDYPAARALRGEIVLDMDFLHAGAPGRARWRRVSGIPVHGDNKAVAAALVVIVDIDGEKRAAERQALLTREVDHRAKNMLAVVQAALRLTRAEDIGSFVQLIEGRVAALSRAQMLLSAEHWSGADLHSLLRGELSAFLDREGSGPQVALRGPRLTIPADATQPLSMAIHELATNATKHGALSRPNGLVSVEWQIRQAGTEHLRLRWAETGGPPTQGPPSRQGFGSRVLNGTLRNQLGGQVVMTWDAAGLVCDIDFPLRDTPADTAADAQP
ncbi:Two-component sensor histidine kinase, contains HisKA and HATPase domains [Roseomonas rosea]|uniref:histidine kinase n=1 Tax=Muricoccus roseus TaxID=198092 RepID=A0A1M6MX44_9PROT|nr:HWE histidine kinase domain-containing protein [Roseomonas rosea]SHJ88047.1 Two-component sensor histidine kinase, contains HisKA and HATPase domains [Roseomonas rosea]